MKEKAIDWEKIHKYLKESEERFEQIWNPSEDEIKNILEIRAKALAKEEVSSTDEYIEVVEFMITYEKYGLETKYISEVYPLTDITPLPCTPSFVMGIINLHGQIMSIIDLKKFFGLPEKALTDNNKIILLHSDTMDFGILADEIIGTRFVPVRELKESVVTLKDIQAEYLKCVTKERLIVLDADKLLTDKSIRINEEVSELGE